MLSVDDTLRFNFVPEISIPINYYIYNITTITIQCNANNEIIQRKRDGKLRF